MKVWPLAFEIKAKRFSVLRFISPEGFAAWKRSFGWHCLWGFWFFACWVNYIPSSLDTLLPTSFIALATQPPQEIGEDGVFNIKTPTMGGKQFWTDHVWRQGWRIQQNALTGHWRLLNAANTRYAWGTRLECQEVLDRNVPKNTLQVKHVVVLLHGLMRSSSSMHAMGQAISKELEVQPIYFEYASTRSSIGDHAHALEDFLESLPEDVSISFVGHSMGNIVLRHYWSNMEKRGAWSQLRRIKAVVMLGPPNQGSSIARQLAKTGVFGWVAGRGGLELGAEWKELQQKLATPQCPFGIVAGKLPENAPANPLVDGSGDFVVSVDETKLAGAADMLIVPKLHSFLMDDPHVQQATINFLRTGSRFSP